MLQAIHDFIIDEIKQKTPEIQDCGAYVTLKDKINSPAIFLELEDSSAEPAGDGTVSVTAKFRLDCVVSDRISDSNIQAQSLAMNGAYLLHNAKFYKVNCQPVIIHSTRKNDFNPDYNGVTVWSIDFSTEFSWGESSFKPIEQKTVFIGIDPKTGPEHIKDYKKIEFNTNE